jgi:predicted SAM-dependent methyltransferase
VVEFNILDVGCGKNKRGDVGIDYSRDSEADVIADACFLPFIDGVFDGVVNNHVIEHSPNSLAFLREQYRILKNNAKLTLVTDNAQYFRFSVLSFKLYGTRHEDYPDHCMIFYPKNIVKRALIDEYWSHYLRVMKNYLKPQDKVLDIGCGPHGHFNPSEKRWPNKANPTSLLLWVVCSAKQWRVHG